MARKKNKNRAQSNEDGLDYYFKYDYLTTDNLIEILRPTKEIYSIIWHDIYAEELNEYYTLKRIIPIEPQILIRSINTGESVNLKLVDAYVPRVKFLRKGDVEVQLPRKMGIVALVGYFTVTTLTAFSGLGKSILETQKAFYEKRKAEIEYEIKINELNKLDKAQKTYLESLNKETYLNIENKSYELRNNIIQSENITNFFINGVEVHKREEQSDEGNWTIIDDDIEE